MSIVQPYKPTKPAVPTLSTSESIHSGSTSMLAPTCAPERVKPQLTTKDKMAIADAARIRRCNSSAKALVVLDVGSKETLTDGQARVLAAVLEDKGVFFTGPAGSGKSFTLKHIIGALKKKYHDKPDAVAVTASTGLAAVALGGRTLHSWAAIGIGEQHVDWEDGSPLANGTRGIVLGFLTLSEWERKRDGVWVDLKEREENAWDNVVDLVEIDPKGDLTPQEIERRKATVFPLVRWTTVRGEFYDLVGYEKWVIKGKNGAPLAERNQLPIVLSWAMTIHKAQGQTMENVSVDLTGTFDSRQPYVALSQAKTPEGLFCIGDPTQEVSEILVRWVVCENSLEKDGRDGGNQ
ncbi:hypothetical protein DACRYDRAFT_108781 [Dacryopinax primogenitus]|uniref:ATP-dependent DNA helicase n=1 Tax=Dacryopinax primogenitus (strain DJM 731) TaxID=1858805 RepID=M5FWH0_DACPD|nr:uncharacterized protein DACRYDRAFT_108781 [Dacryopinax primogenitus]EJU00714.1 hypothetical protein DACRYDRAFT_108781 [Dacryopinax primogenitus]